MKALDFLSKGVKKSVYKQFCLELQGILKPQIKNLWLKLYVRPDSEGLDCLQSASAFIPWAKEISKGLHYQTSQVVIVFHSM